MRDSSISTNKKYKLFLINPYQHYRHYVTQEGVGKFLGKKNSMPPLSLPTVAALTPSHYDIRIIDENLEKIPWKEKPDIVGITTLSTTFSRAFELADKYRKQGIPVVLGGSYISYTVEEGLKHADSIIVGEAEGIWEKCLEDFETGQMKPVYRSEFKCEFKFQPIPRWDLIPTEKFISLGVQATRGCPFNCEFCLVSEMFGHKMRFRDIDNVIEELKSLPVKRILFVDDNLTINKEYAKELIKKIKPFGLTWVCQTSIDVADDEELLDIMADSGCFQILIGFDSLNPGSLEEIHKYHNKIARFEVAIDKIHSRGIHVLGSFVVGFDHDMLEEFDHIFEFTQRTQMLYAMLSILECSPGTPLYYRLIRENRWYGSRPYLGGGMTPNMHYMNMSQKDLFEKYYETVNKLMSVKNIGERAIKLFSKGYFTQNREVPDEFSFAFRLKIVFKIIAFYLISFNKEKRELFYKMVRLFIHKKLSFNELIFFFIAVIGYQNHLKILRSGFDNFYEQIKQVDIGPWINHSSMTTVSN